MVRFERVSKHYGGERPLLADVTFRVHSGERVGVVGPNGAGKSTLFGMITGAITPDAGRVEVRNNIRIGHVRQEPAPASRSQSLIEFVEQADAEAAGVEHEIRTIEHRLGRGDLAQGVRQQLLSRLGELQHRLEVLGAYERAHRARAALAGLGFPDDALDRPVTELSGGWHMRAELARVLISSPDLLLLDEPTNYLDLAAVEWLQDFLRSFPGTMMLISHDRWLLDALTTVTIEVHAGRAVRWPGAWSTYRAQRDARIRQMEAARRNLEREERRIERFVERFRAKNTKASQARSRLKMLERIQAQKEQLTSFAPVERPAIRLPTPSRCGAEVVRLDGVGFRYPDGPWIFRNVDLRIQRGEHIGIVGRNGTGKSTLLRMLAGRIQPAAGVRRLGHNVRIGYYSQEHFETLNPDHTVLQSAAEARRDQTMTEGDIRTLLGAFGFHGDDVDKQVRVLSGGEKSRLRLIRLLLDAPNFLLLDEPTTHLDIASREALQDALAAFDGTLCLVSHDVALMRGVARDILTIEGGSVRRWYGDYDYYLAKRTQEREARERVAEPTPDAESGTKDDATGQALPARNDRRERRRVEAERRQRFADLRRPWEERLQKAEHHIENLEAEREKLLQRLAEGTARDRGSADFASMNRRLREIQEEIERETAVWDRAAEIIEELDRAREAGEEPPVVPAPPG